MSDCLFCKIIDKEIPGQVVYEDDLILIFKDINPQAPVHLLAIPKKHIANICDPKLLEDGVAVAIFSAVGKVVSQMGIEEDGFRVVVNRGKNAGEAVPHLHFHILAGRALDWPPG